MPTNELGYCSTYCVEQANFAETIDLRTTDASGSVVAEGWITCAPSLIDGKIAQALTPPIMEVVSSQFRYWQGGLTFRFHFSMPQVATARLAFVTLYGKTTTPATLPIALGQYAHVFDLSSNNLVFDVEVPYRSVFPRLSVPSGRITPGQELQYTMGRWALLVINPLRTTDNTAQQCYINVFRGAADDFKLSTYGHNNYSLVAKIGFNFPPPTLLAEEKFEDRDGFISVERKPDKEDKAKMKRLDSIPKRLPCKVTDYRYIPQMMKAEDNVGDTGVTFSETKPVAPTRDNVLETKTTVRAQEQLPEEQINFNTLAARPQLVTTFTWATTDADGKVLFSGRMPWDFIVGSNTGPFQQFTYWKGFMEITVKVQATAFHAGTLIVYFVPLTSAADITAYHDGSKQSQTICQHAFLVAAESNSVTLRIPYQQIRAWLNTDDTAIDCGGLRVAVFNPLLAGPSELKDAEISVFASFPDSHFKIIDPLAYESMPFRSFVAERKARQSEYNYRPQMLGANGPLVQSAQSDNVQQTVAPPSRSVVRDDGVQRMTQSIRHVCRRGHLVSYHEKVSEEGDTYRATIPVSSIFNPGGSEDAPLTFRRSNLSFFASFFRVWHGTPVFYTVGRGDIDLAYRAMNSDLSSSNRAFDFDQFFGSSDLSDGRRVWAGPLDFGISDIGMLADKTPFTTQYNCLLLPKKPGDTDAKFNSGNLFVSVVDAKEEIRVYAHLGDNSRFGMLYIVPQILIAANVYPDTYPNAAGTVDVAPYIRIVHDATQPALVLNRRMQSWPRASTYTGTEMPYTVTSLTYVTADMSDDELRELGYPIYPGMTRNSVLGIQQVSRNLGILAGVNYSSELKYRNTLTTPQISTIQNSTGVPTLPSVVDGVNTCSSIKVDNCDFVFNPECCREWYDVDPSTQIPVVMPTLNNVVIYKNFCDVTGTVGGIPHALFSHGGDRYWLAETP